MRNILARWLVIGLTIIAFTLLYFANNRVWAHEAHPVPVEVGSIHPMSATCYASGASKIAMANLLTGDFNAGNMMFDRLAAADPPECFGWGFPIPLKIAEVTYIGTQGALHVYIVKFGRKAFSVVAVRRGDGSRGTPDHLREPTGFSI